MIWFSFPQSYPQIVLSKQEMSDYEIELCSNTGFQHLSLIFTLLLMIIKDEILHSKSLRNKMSHTPNLALFIKIVSTLIFVARIWL